MTRWIPVAGLLLLACEDLPEVTAVGAHVEVAADHGRELCGGTLAHMDAFVAVLSDQFSLAPPTGADRFRFYWLEHEEFFDRTHCPEISSACASASESFARMMPVNHELVHNVSAALGRSRPLFVEGLAVAFEGLGDEFDLPTFGVSTSEPLPDQDVLDLLAVSTSDELIQAGGYPVAGAFTASLIHRHGLDAYVRAYSSIDRRASVAEVDRVFRDELGESLDDSIAAFEAIPRTCTHRRYDAKLIECAAPELAWSGDVLTYHRTLDCAQDDVVGPYAGDSVVAFHTLEIAEAGGYELRVLGEPGGEPGGAVSLVACDRCGGRERVASAGGAPQTHWLEPGRYSVRLVAAARAPTSVGLRLTRVPEFPRPEYE